MNAKQWTILSVACLALALAAPLQADSHMARVVVKVENLVPYGGVYFTPVWVGFHDGMFDLFDVGGLAGAGLERIAEDGDAGPLRAEFAAAAPQGLDDVILSPDGFPGAPVFDPGERSSAEFMLNTTYHRYMSFASMIIPSNDAFIGNHNPWAIELFDAAGNFKGKKIVTVLGSMVWDAGTEWNNEMDAAFLNQSAGDTGVTTMAPIMPHPGFLGSYGNPGSDWLVLGSTNAAGTMIDPVGGDFSLPYAVVARITVDWVPDPPQTPDPAMIPGVGVGAGPPMY